MAYQKEIEKHGLNFKEAYFKIHSIYLNNIDDEVHTVTETGDFLITWENKKTTSALIFIYGDKIARRNNVAPIHQLKITFEYNFDSCDNIMKQAYTKLKTIEEFNGGIDV